MNTPWENPAHNLFFRQAEMQTGPEREAESSRESAAEFCHMAAHDLKAPARRIAQFCTILKEESNGMLNAECRDYVERIAVNALRLQNLVDDIFAFTQSAAPQEERQRIDTGIILKEVIASLQKEIDSAHAEIRIGTMPEVNAYPAALAALFRNLIDNAIKYRGPENPLIRIACTEGKTHFAFTIADNGSGMEEKFHDRIFKPFERLHTQDEVEGSGLGLAICERIAALHGGEIWLEHSVPGIGSVFQFTLARAPLRPSASPIRS